MPGQSEPQGARRIPHHARRVADALHKAHHAARQAGDPQHTPGGDGGRQAPTEGPIRAR